MTTPLDKALSSSQTGSLLESEYAELNYSFSKDFIGFQGHFPGYPVLPAVIQCRLGIACCSQLCGKSLTLVALSKAKYKQQVAPNTPITVQATYRKNTEPKDLHFSVKITGNQGLIASFHLQLAETLNTRIGA